MEVFLFNNVIVISLLINVQHLTNTCSTSNATKCENLKDRNFLAALIVISKKVPLYFLTL